MKDVLLIDFGASRIKWYYNGQIYSKDTPPANIGFNGEKEIPLISYQKTFNAIISLCGASLKSIWVCSEMHGFIITDELGTPITNYISWQDTRNKTNIDHSLFQQQTGMSSSIGTPFNNIQKLKLPFKFRLLSLIDWLLLQGGDFNYNAHPTMSAGMGFYSIKTRNWSEKLFALAGIDINQVILPQFTSNFYIGHIMDIPVYGGLGDFQTAIYGAGFPKGGDCCINLGTGSQIISQQRVFKEQRICLDGNIYSTTTHIPSGKVLGIFANFIDSIALEPVFWDEFEHLSLEKVMNSMLNIDLNLFNSSYNYINGGNISHITEENMTMDALIASIARCWLMQYVNLVPRGTKSIILSGKLGRLPYVAPFLQEKLHIDVSSTFALIEEETLNGLFQLAEEYNVN